MDTKGQKNRERIDLGIGAILAGVSTQSGVPNHKGTEVSIELATSAGQADAETWTLGAGQDIPRQSQPKSEFDILADERKWPEIVRCAEPRLADTQDVEAKLWWIRGHLGAFSMPCSFLAAPLESLCRNVSISSQSETFLALLKETGLLAVHRLQEIGDKAQVENLRKALEQIGIREERGSRERKRTATSSFRSIDFAVPASVAASAALAAAPKRTGAKGRRMGWTSACIAAVAILFMLDHLFPHLRVPQLDIASEDFVSASTYSEQGVSTPERKDPSGRLGALFYSIDAARREGAVAGAAQPQEPVQQVEQAQPQLARAPARAPSSSVTGHKEVVNTTGPVEGGEFKDRIDRARSEDERTARSDLRGGAPQAVLPGTTPQGFEDQKTYTVMARTSVLSAPSYGGRVIGHLERGDRVLVEGRLGRWLRLRSKKGRGGYVVAADVEEFLEGDLSVDR